MLEVRSSVERRLRNDACGETREGRGMASFDSTTGALINDPDQCTGGAVKMTCSTRQY